MAKMNVAQFAGELGLPVGLLLEQLQAAGVAKLQEGGHDFGTGQSSTVAAPAERAWKRQCKSENYADPSRNDRDQKIRQYWQAAHHTG